MWRDRRKPVDGYKLQFQKMFVQSLQKLQYLENWENKDNYLLMDLHIKLKIF